jgi:hypothetical protein
MSLSIQQIVSALTLSCAINNESGLFKNLNHEYRWFARLAGK